MAKRRIMRLDTGTLEAAHGRFQALADKEPRGEVRDALRLAALITSTLQLAVGAAFDLRIFLDDVMGTRSPSP